MAIHHESYPRLEIGRTVSDDRVVISRDDLAIAVTCIRALRQGFMFRVSIIADHEVDPVKSFRFDRSPVEGGLDLRLVESDPTGAETSTDLQLQGGGGGGSRYEFEFWAPVQDDSAQATVHVAWAFEQVPPTPVLFALEVMRQAGADTLRIAGPPVGYP